MTKNNTPLHYNDLLSLVELVEVEADNFDLRYYPAYEGIDKFVVYYDHKRVITGHLNREEWKAYFVIFKREYPAFVYYGAIEMVINALKESGRPILLVCEVYIHFENVRRCKNFLTPLGKLGFERRVKCSSRYGETYLFSRTINAKLINQGEQ